MQITMGVVYIYGIVIVLVQFSNLGVLLDVHIFVVISVIFTICNFTVEIVWIMTFGFKAIVQSYTHADLYLIRLAIPMDYKVTRPRLSSSLFGTITTTAVVVVHLHYSKVPTKGPFIPFNLLPVGLRCDPNGEHASCRGRRRWLLVEYYCDARALYPSFPQ